MYHILLLTSYMRHLLKIYRMSAFTVWVFLWFLPSKLICTVLCVILALWNSNTLKPGIQFANLESLKTKPKEGSVLLWSLQPKLIYHLRVDQHSHIWIWDPPPTPLHSKKFCSLLMFWKTVLEEDKQCDIEHHNLFLCSGNCCLVKSELCFTVCFVEASGVFD